MIASAGHLQLREATSNPVVYACADSHGLAV